MVPSKVFSSVIVGMDAKIIEVETDISYGLFCFNIVGLGDKAIEESKERVGAAIKSANLSPPGRQPIRVLVNLAPAHLQKQGSLYDLPIALGYLLASKQIKFNSENKIFIGELALDGRLRPIKGILPIALMAKKQGIKEIILPKANAPEAALVKELKIIGAENLKETIDYLEGRKLILPCLINIENLFEKTNYPLDIGWIKGQEYAKRALEIAAAGSHNLLMEGPPGAGKTLLAKTLPSILPSLIFEEALEVTKIYSIAGLLSEEKFFINTPPFRSPHHTTSETALIGGGNPPRPGEITLAHRGVLFLDEFPEFHRDVIESLRQPLEEGKITIARIKHSLTLPTRFILIAATNPCPCGYLNDPEKQCQCSPSQIAKYKRKLSGPLMDRIDLFIEVPSLKYEKLIQPEIENLSIKIKNRVGEAKKIQKKRFKNQRTSNNSEINIPQIKKLCQIDQSSETLLKNYINSGRLSARGYHRVLRVARTIADLENSEKILYNHLAEAIMYRTKKE